MYNRKYYLTGALVAAYLGGSGLFSLVEWFSFWQMLSLGLPFATLALGLVWTVPYPDYAATRELKAPPIANTDPPGRKIIWLNGLWDFKIPRDRRWRRIDAPRPWNTIRGLEYYDGEAVYRRLFSIPEGWSLGRVYLNFRGANYLTVVSLDGRKVGRHEGGYTPFRFDITDRVGGGRECELEVMVDNRLARSTVPNVVGWRNEGGILREVYLETMQRINILDVQVVTDPDMKGRAKITLNVKIDNPDWEPKDYHIEIFSPQGALVHDHKVESWGMQQLEHAFEINFASLWSPENPALYTARVSLLGREEDQFVATFGVRKIELDQGKILLNGKQLIPRGITRVEEFFDTGRTQTSAGIKQDLQMIKDAGFNFVRLGDLPAHPRVLDYCDRLGLMVSEELPAWCGMGFELADPHYQQAAEAQLREMVERDRNHPCILAWGLAHNIENESHEGRWFIEQMVKVTRSLDNRPVYIAVGGAPEEDKCVGLVDMLFVILRGSTPGQIDRLVRETAAWKDASGGKPVVPLFTGLGAQRGASQRWGGHYSEEEQALFLMEFIKRFDAHKAAAGWVAGALADYRDPSSFLGPAPFMRLYGILNHWREPKTSYDVIRKLLTTGKETAVKVVYDRRVPLTSFSIIVGIASMVAALAAWAFTGKTATALFYNPNIYVAAHPHGGAKVAFLTFAITAICWAVIVNRYFKSAPRRMMSAIHMPYFILLSRVVRSESLLFLWGYFTLAFFWVSSTTAVQILFHPDWSFGQMAAVTGALCVPDMIFFLTAFLRIPLTPVLALFHAWRFTLAWIVLGPLGAIIYVIIMPGAIIGGFFAFIEANFHLLKYVKK